MSLWFLSLKTLNICCHFCFFRWLRLWLWSIEKDRIVIQLISYCIISEFTKTQSFKQSFSILFVFWDVTVRKTLLELLTRKMDHMNCSNSDACTCWDRQSNLFWHGVQLDNQVLNFRYPWLWQTRLNVFRTISTERIVDTTSMDA